MAVLALVRVLISIFTKETDGPKLRDYLWNCLTDGMASTLFASPARWSGYSQICNILTSSLVVICNRVLRVRDF